MGWFGAARWSGQGGQRHIPVPTGHTCGPPRPPPLSRLQSPLWETCGHPFTDPRAQMKHRARSRSIFCVPGGSHTILCDSGTKAIRFVTLNCREGSESFAQRCTASRRLS